MDGRFTETYDADTKKRKGKEKMAADGDEEFFIDATGRLHASSSSKHGCNSNRAKHWRNRRSEIIEIGRKRNFEVVTTQDEWMKECDGTKYCPTLRCLECNAVVTSTTVHSMQQQGSIGCACKSNRAKHWRNRRSEIIEIGRKRNFEVVTTQDEWMKECDGSKYRPTLRCLECNAVVTSTTVHSMQQGSNIGCACNSNRAKHWRNRRSEIIEIGRKRNFEVVTTQDEWMKECDGSKYRPTLRCLECNAVVTSTTVNSMQQQGCIGCACKSNRAKHWRNRRSEIIEIGRKRNFEVVTTQDEWMKECDGCYYRPTIRCLECNAVVTSTTVNNMQQQGFLGCACNNKTEGKLGDWLRAHFPNVKITPQHEGPGRTKFDFHLAFPDGFKVLVELDGPQHFWKSARYYSAEGCQRDLEKEIWAKQQGLCVVRVLQENVWNDLYGWKGWIIRSFQDARSGEPRPLTPDDREYRSKESAYVRARD
ncbi:hypothetical protein RI054_23g100210 [Pseudoscourfieldia marina]